MSIRRSPVILRYNDDGEEVRWSQVSYELPTDTIEAITKLAVQRGIARNRLIIDLVKEAKNGSS